MNPEQSTPPVTPPSQPGGWAPLPEQPPQAPVAPSTFDAQPAVSAHDALGEHYLNEIAVTEPVHINKFAIIGLIGGVLVLLVVILAIMMNSGGPSLSTQAKSVNGRVNTLKTVVGDQQKHLADNTLSTANATLSSVLTTISSDLASVMKDKKIALSSAAGTAEKSYAAALTKKLDDAYQRGTLDRTYAPQMVYELSTLRTKLIAMKKSSSSKSIRTFCDESVANLDAIITSFKEFSSTD